MVDKKVVLMRFGNSSRGVSFSSDGGNDREALEKVIRKVYRKVYREEIPEDTPSFQTVMCPLFLWTGYNISILQK